MLPIEPAFLAGLNHVLRGADWARLRLLPYAGRHVIFHLPPMQFAFSVTHDGYFEAMNADARADVILHLPAATPFLLLQGIDKVMSDVRVEGNAEFATELSFVFRNLRWDLEEDLARVVGDITAHRMVQGAGRIFEWQKQMASHVGANLSEYLIYESNQLVSKQEFAAFRDEFALFQDMLTRLEARTKTLA